MISKDIFIATHRFGYGTSLSDIEAIGGEPKAWLEQQIRRDQVVPDFFKPLLTSEQAMKRLEPLLKMKKELKKEKRFSTEEKQKIIKKEIKNTINNRMKEVLYRTQWAMQTQTPFVERMVHFWSNHFTVSTTQKGVAPFAGSFEREAIRPYIFGRFSDMLKAVLQHPAMLIYLDNIRSIGPNSRVGKRRKKGLNENLARELLELHTLGVQGGYSQFDVEQLARMLTGWSLSKKATSNNRGVFEFYDRLHEPGDKILLGKKYPNQGVEEVLDAIEDLALHPSTAHFLATKIARHFISDNPPENVIKKLQKSYLQSKGNLKKVMLTLIALPEVWQNPMAKAKTPNDLIITTGRVLGASAALKEKELFFLFESLNQLPHTATSPAGWDDRAKSWLGPEAVLRRIEFCYFIARKTKQKNEPEAVLKQCLGEVASANTRFAVLRAPSRLDALTLLMASPEFQRR